jgi:hypothetical protein
MICLSGALELSVVGQGQSKMCATSFEMRFVAASRRRVEQLLYVTPRHAMQQGGGSANSNFSAYRRYFTFVLIDTCGQAFLINRDHSAVYVSTNRVDLVFTRIHLPVVSIDRSSFV